jgi:predicted AlkP superfamily pyrophosphatase or phosphodiesterase
MEARVVLISIDGFADFYWRDSRVRIPTLRALAERGTLAAGMDAVFPTTTWPTHVSLATGVLPARHGIVANSILNRKSGEVEDLTGDPVYDAADLLRAPTIYDCAHAAGLMTAAIDWPATRNSRTLGFNLPFFKDQRVFEAQTLRETWAELGALGYPLDRQGEWAELPKRFMKDAMVGDLAAHVFHEHDPHLLLVHFLSADSHQHLYGPRSPEAYWAMEYIDERIGRFLGTLSAAELDRTTIVVVSDHGFLPVTREIRPNVRLRRLGLLDVSPEGRPGRADARFVMNHGAGYVYAGDRRNPEAVARDLVPELSALEGVSAVWTAPDYAALGLPTPDENALVGDLLLEAAPGYCFGNDASGQDELGTSRYRGTHGQRPSEPDNVAFFLAAGPPIRRGEQIGRITSRDVAPTIAHLLGVSIDGVTGRLLTEILA